MCFSHVSRASNLSTPKVWRHSITSRNNTRLSATTHLRATRKRLYAACWSPPTVSSFAIGLPGSTRVRNIRHSVQLTYLMVQVRTHKASQAQRLLLPVQLPKVPKPLVVTADDRGHTIYQASCPS